jgi:hypothetical protein
MGVITAPGTPTAASEPGQPTDDARRKVDVTRADLPFVALAIGSTALLLYLGRSLTYYLDEWVFLTFDGGIVDYLRPYNEHWSTLPLLLYRATFALVGLRSYMPYLAELIALHVLAVSGFYAVGRARVGSFLATLIAIPLLLIGSGAENLFWGFQTGFVGSVTFGVWALFFLERAGRRSGVIASVLLVGSLMSSGMGLFFLLAAGVRTLFDPAVRRQLLAVAIPAGIYLVWFALVGRDPVGTKHPLVVDLYAVKFAARGIDHSIETFLGLDDLPDLSRWGLLLFIGLWAVTGLRLIRRRPSPPWLALACLLAIGVMYTLIAFVRARLTEQDFATVSRYVYVAAFFLAFAIVDLLPRRGSWPRWVSRRAMGLAVVLVAGLVVATKANVDALETGVAPFRYRAEVTRAYVGLVEAHQGAPWLDEGALWGGVPPPSELRGLIARHGSPLEDELVSHHITAPRATAEEAALLAVVGNRFALLPATKAGIPVPLTHRTAQGVVLEEDGSCLRARFSGDAPALAVTVPGGARVRLTSNENVSGYVRLGHDFSPSRPIGLDLTAGVPRDVTVPDVGDARPWQVEVDPIGAPASILVCAFRPEA